MANMKRTVLSAVGVVGVATVLLMPSARGGHEVVIKNGKFSPSEEFVGKGDTVTWIHDDAGKAYSVTADGGAFDSNPECSTSASDRCLQAGEIFEWKLDKTGRYPYHSRIGGGPDGEGMAGTIVVVEKGQGVSTSSTR